VKEKFKKVEESGLKTLEDKERERVKRKEEITEEEREREEEKSVYSGGRGAIMLHKWGIMEQGE